MTVSFETLVPYAVRVSQFPNNENARSNLILRLHLISDAVVLRALATRFAFNPEVAIPVWRRLATVDPGNIQLKLDAAYAFYSNGMDAEAIQAIEEALAIDENFVPAWELKAGLCPDAKERRQIFERILKIEPGNRMAVDHLIILGRPID